MQGILNVLKVCFQGFQSLVTLSLRNQIEVYLKEKQSQSLM